ncbi:MAG: MBL fold metallo-hydrolase [Phycisphaerales bacterium]
MRITDDAPPAPASTSPPLPTDAAPGLCVLASSSAGNCTLLRWRGTTRWHACLIDLGLSPRRTRAALATFGLTLADLDAVILTHLDTDHCHGGWAGTNAALFGKEDAPLPRSVHLLLAHSHMGRAARVMLNAGRFTPFKSHFQLPGPAAGAVDVRVHMNSHDELGTACFRFALPEGELGFATDVGHATDELIAHLRGVDVLAIESNYCPRMQLASNRSDALKDRIMGGGGHLSNQQAAAAVRAIEPRSHAVLLHLSRQCNTPELVAAEHEGADYAVTIARHDGPTRWVRIGAGQAAPVPHVRAPVQVPRTAPADAAIGIYA